MTSLLIFRRLWKLWGSDRIENATRGARRARSCRNVRGPETKLAVGHLSGADAASGPDAAPRSSRDCTC